MGTTTLPDGVQFPIGVLPDSAVTRAAQKERLEREVRQWRAAHATDYDAAARDDAVSLRMEVRRRLQENASEREAERVREMQRAHLLAEIKAAESRLARVRNLDDVDEAALLEFPLPTEDRMAAARERLAALERRYATVGMERWWDLEIDDLVKLDPAKIGLVAQRGDDDDDNDDVDANNGGNGNGARHPRCRDENAGPGAINAPGRGAAAKSHARGPAIVDV
jgi:hypothetical protein